MLRSLWRLACFLWDGRLARPDYAVLDAHQLAGGARVQVRRHR